MSGEPEDDVARRWRWAEPGAVLLDGFHAVKHAVRFGARLRCVVAVDPEGTAGLAADLAPDVAAPLRESAVRVSARLLRELVSRPHPTAVAALADRPEPVAAGRVAPTVLLDNPRHLGNVGAVVRVVAGFGAAGVLTTGDMDPWHPQVVRSAAGLHFATGVARTGLERLPRGPLLALDAGGEDIRSVAIPDDAVLAFGSERRGLSERVWARADGVLSLPMRDGVSSYNLATSVAMVLFHWSTRAR
ncbi:tRNA G18 (ribose-2'-O)-methylase SpoU [Stackebrandtia albiflava]|uniref:tRNA G18 (Ribose-2'-O)-methylase SpoU n=1 Tax=Stackebrandtia albiflava TaxID=406432 RepID=A0A562UPJ0_9ACTN|nr:TrmH family RNA methyltransferase [Stackebrandtia albiflava]TWJ07529.1 tRNA G18 (ribose-2'-O)-methylase SpoU [Stackebrandtia albiflava]